MLYYFCFGKKLIILMEINKINILYILKFLIMIVGGREKPERRFCSHIPENKIK